MLSVLEGAINKGKSTMTIDLMARLSRGWAMPGLLGYNTPAASIVIGLEDHFENVFVPRLMAAGADLTKVNYLTGFRINAAGKESEEHRLVLTVGDIERLGETILKTGTKFVFFDSVMGLLPGKIDANSDQGTRAVLEPLAQMAEQVGASILIGRHWVKGASTRVASERGIGSVAWAGVPRSVLQVAEHPDDETRRVLAVAKGNLAPKQEHLEFTIPSKEITLPGGEVVSMPSIVWGGTCSLHIDDLGGKKLTSERQTIAKTCEDWMVGYFDEEHRSVSSNQLAEDAKEAGYSFAAMRRARDKMQGEGRLAVRKTGTAWMVNWLEEGVQAKMA
jgi:putative DNA primase/helicase